MSFLKDRFGRFLIVAIVVYIVFFFTICIWKYFTFQYNGLDLAIFNQVFFNTSTGNWFDFSIHPHKYLGDHFTPFLFFLLPFYLIYKNPLTLLFLQTVFLSLGAIPVYLIAKKVLNSKWALLVALAYLLNPFVANINLFEFHLLPIAIFLILLTVYFYLEKKFWQFFVFLILSLLVREDVALVVVMFGFIALLDQFKTKKWDLKWIFVPFILGAVYFLGAMKVIGYFAENSDYKFLIYYSWLGNGFVDIIKNFFLHPQKVLAHIFTLANLEMILGFIMPMFFIPVLRPKYLLLSFFIFLQIILGAAGGGGLILQTHYASLFIPGLMVSGIFSIKILIDWNKKRLKKKRSLDLQPVFVLILVLSIIYSGIALGSFYGIGKKLINNQPNQDLVAVKQQFIEKIPANASVVTTYEFLPYLSNRKYLFSLHYVFLGKTQFAFADYELPVEPDYLLIDFADFIIYQTQMEKSAIYKDCFQTGNERIMDLIKNYKLIDIFDTIALFKKSDDDQTITLIEATESTDSDTVEMSENMMQNLVWHFNEIDKQKAVAATLYFKNLEKKTTNFILKMKVNDFENNLLYAKYYPLAYGLYPSSNWQENENININYWFYLPKELKQKVIDQQANINFEILYLDAQMILDKTGYMQMQINQEYLVDELDFVIKLQIEI